MSVKVKRGLGLLVVAVLAWLVDQMLGDSPPALAELVLLAATAACLLVGLALLAWGLLRE